MATILLIKPVDLVKGSPLGGNIDIDSYVSVIKESQVFVIEPILGTKLYNKILTDFEGDSLAGLYLTIHEDYIKPILIHTVAAEYIMIASYNVANGGVFKHQPENGSAINKSEVDFLANKQRSKADVYIERLQRYLCDKNSDIPEYTSSQDNPYDQKPDKEVNTFGGWFLGNISHGTTNAEQEIYRDIRYDEGK
ncbi:hypothetical protein [Flagellimonas sp. CMM7]|uniref:DUF6712 family protein n=1 Tax=Flagellimonas sp. CMM7 TaxID=2654676 RepID=UPI001969A87E|nr:hypothetical protein [Flagellimonas sp. CMM7]UII79998.1 hypothetical protein LV704_00405 [Flagellimonas sp. CMM7]